MKTLFISRTVSQIIAGLKIQPWRNGSKRPYPKW
jgi:hypothetical protein